MLLGCGVFVATGAVGLIRIALDGACTGGVVLERLKAGDPVLVCFERSKPTRAVIGHPRRLVLESLFFSVASGIAVFGVVTFGLRVRPIPVV